MRYKDPNKLSVGAALWAFFYVLVIIGSIVMGVWYTWLDISTKMAIKDMAKQQEATHDN